jgi:transcriptional regulator with XRE-family HTH domain
MNLVRFGLIVRALRRRRGLRQIDLAILAGISQQAVSRIERGQSSRMSVQVLMRVAEELEIDLDLVARWRGGALDRVLDARHAILVGAIAGRLARAGWSVLPEVSYSEYGERGSIDLLGFRERDRALLVVEVKSELTSIEATLRKHDEKSRLAPRIAGDRFGLRGASDTRRLLVLPDTGASRARVLEHAAVLDTAYPLRGRLAGAWLRAPVPASTTPASPAPATASALIFVPLTPGVSGGRVMRSPQRVIRPTHAGRRARAAASRPGASRVNSRRSSQHSPGE